MHDSVDDILMWFLKDLCEQNGITLEELSDKNNNVQINISTSNGEMRTFGSLNDYVKFMHHDVNTFGFVNRKEGIIRLCPINGMYTLDALVETLGHERGHTIEPIFKDDPAREEAKARAIGDAALWAYKKALEIMENNYLGRRIIMDLNNSNFGQIKGLNEALRPFISISEGVEEHYVMAAKVKQAFTVDTGDGIVSIPNLNGGWFLVRQADGSVTGMDFDEFAKCYTAIEAIPRAATTKEPEDVEADDGDDQDADMDKAKSDAETEGSEGGAEGGPGAMAKPVADRPVTGKTPRTIETIGPDDVGTISAADLVGDGDGSTDTKKQ